MEVFNWRRSCVLVAGAESRFVGAFSPIFRSLDLNGVQVVFAESAETPLAVDCVNGVVDVELSSIDVDETEFAHGLAHIADDCWYDESAPDPLHPFWADRGVWFALAQVSGP